MKQKTLIDYAIETYESAEFQAYMAEQYRKMIDRIIKSEYEPSRKKKRPRRSRRLHHT